MEAKINKWTKKDETFYKMKSTAVNTFEGKVSLYNLCYGVGVKNRVEYYNMVERLKPKKERDIHNPTEIKKVVKNRGLEFNDGFSIKYVDNDVYKLFKEVPVVSIRERI